MGSILTKKQGLGVKNPCVRGVVKDLRGVKPKNTKKGGNMSGEKKKYAFYASPEQMERIEQLYEADGCRSKTEFIEKAVDFYCGYLTAKDYKEYLPEVILTTMQGTLGSMENRMARMLFKMAVEVSLMMHVIAGTNDVDEDALDSLRGKCVQDCKKINGSISFEDAVKYQYGDD